MSDSPRLSRSLPDRPAAAPVCIIHLGVGNEASLDLSLLPANVAAYCEALLHRYSNPRVRRQLAQIAPDGSTKPVVRIVPTLRVERAQDRLPAGCATTIGVWVRHLRGRGAPIRHPGADNLRQHVADGDLATAVPVVVDFLDPGRGTGSAFAELVLRQADEITAAVTAAVTAEP